MTKTSPIQSVTVERMLAYLPRERRHALPRVLSEKVPDSIHRRPTIEAARLPVVFVANRADINVGDPNWAAKLPELDVAYAAGWQFAYAIYGASARELHVYLWRPVREVA